jgi:hypothetical protein
VPVLVVRVWPTTALPEIVGAAVAAGATGPDGGGGGGGGGGGAAPSVSTTSSGFGPLESRLANATAVALAVAIAMLTAPSPLTSGVTSKLTQLPLATVGTLAVVPALRAGAFEEVMVISPQVVLATPETVTGLVDVLVAYTRRVALVTAPASPLGLKRR